MAKSIQKEVVERFPPLIYIDMSRDLRQYAKQTNIRLVIGFILVLLIIGDGLILLYFGKGAAIMGIICIFAALLPVLLIIIALWLIDWIARQNNPG